MLSLPLYVQSMIPRKHAKYMSNSNKAVESQNRREGARDQADCGGQKKISPKRRWDRTRIKASS
jgi:hypothetical protein